MTTTCKVRNVVDPDPAFYLDADPGSQTYAIRIRILVSLCRHKKIGHKIYGNTKASLKGWNKTCVNFGQFPCSWILIRIPIRIRIQEILFWVLVCWYAVQVRDIVSYCS